MHHPLSQIVRDAIAQINQQVNHSVHWGHYSPGQSTFPGECRWKVEGGHDWPLNAEVEVSITFTCQHDEPVILKGLTEIEAAL